MAKPPQAPNWVFVASQMEERGVTCQVLKTMIKDKINDAKKFREIGLLKLGSDEESIVTRLKELDRHVCLLPR